jgi:E3 ubiquitin-protein ligase RNF13
MQVRHAEEAGAVAAIVYDDVYEALIIMSKPRDHSEPGIPAVFVAQKTGIVMKKLMSPGATVARITPVCAAFLCLSLPLFPSLRS